MATVGAALGTPPVPHEFSELRRANRSPSIIFGSGLSAGRVPAPRELLTEVQSLAERDLACGHVDGLPETSDALYLWAEKILKRIAGSPGAPVKLRLARAMGLLDNRRWTVDVDLNGALPRHRVIARFAREELWGAVWSLNWDCMLESALENIGFTRGEAVRDQPWLTRYDSVVTDTDFNRISQQNLLCILKPHGCAHSLAKAEEEFKAGNISAAEKLSSRFMITATELQKARSSPLDRKFFYQMISELQAKPLVVAGWSISEPYLRNVIEKPLASLLGVGKKEDLSIIDLEFNAHGHEEITACYKLTKDDVFFQVTPLHGDFDIDNLFLWLQAKYCLDQLITASPAMAQELEKISARFSLPSNDTFLVAWADKFVPAWTRLCWRGNVVDCAGYQPHKLDLNRRNEHVPWRIPKNLPRPDLKAAARLLTALFPSKNTWDFERLPGGLFDASRGRLVIPIPAWGQLNELAGIKPLITGWSPGWPYVETLDMLPLDSTEKTANLDGSVVARLVDIVASFMTLPKFTNPDNIGIAHDMGT